MRSSKAGMLLVIFVAQLLAPILTVWAQTSPPLKNRIYNVGNRFGRVGV
jgi:hypothetical protein